MKKCSLCKKIKNESEFYARGKEKRAMSYCKTCFNDYCQARWIERKKIAISYLGGKCVDCGYDRHYAPMQFHHLHDKEFSWTKLRLMSWKSILKELSKCQLLCANCHAIKHSLFP